MFDTKRVQQDFSDAAVRYDEHAHLQREILRALLLRVRPHLTPQAKILDAGCGTGQLARELKRDDITQLDLAYGMCREADKYSSPTITGDMMTLPFAGASFDLVFSSLVLQWLPDWQVAMQEMRRVLKPGGVLAVVTFGYNTLRELRASLAEVDDAARVLPFIPPDAMWERETITQYFPNLRSITQALKAIGAGNKQAADRRQPLTREKWEAAEHFYRERFGTEQGLPVTWEALYRVELVS